MGQGEAHLCTLFKGNGSSVEFVGRSDSHAVAYLTLIANQIGETRFDEAAPPEIVREQDGGGALELGTGQSK